MAASAPPIPPQRPIVRELFGEQLVDDYAWMRDREDPAVQAHLDAESLHALATIDGEHPSPVGEGVRAQLYAELRARIEARDQSVPSEDGPWLYYSRTEEDDEYPRHCRRERGLDEAPEQVYLDENELAADHDYFDLVLLAISPDHRRCAYLVDLDGDEIYRLQILDLATGELLADTLEGCAASLASLAWLDDETLIYARLDASQRPWQAWRHRLGSDPSTDELIHQEDDGKFFLGLYRARSEAHVILGLDSQVSSECYLIPTSTPDARPVLVEARRDQVEYALAHGREGLFMLSNRSGHNFAVEYAPSRAGASARGEC